ncbi:MAG TPA: hypothetical protein PKZ56_02255 [Candidatus Paceibacterota bacterium]|nr:hypothetical protein [Candidatus Paceibacterota bacterium]
MNKTNGIVIALLIILIGLVGYTIIKPKTSPVIPISQNIEENKVVTDPQTKTTTVSAKTSPYKANGFAFQYDSTAEVKVESYGSGALFYSVSPAEGEGVNETIRLYNEKFASYEAFCGRNIETHQLVVEGKTFTYCDSKAEPARTYFYENRGNTIVIQTQGTNGKPYSYIIPESVEMDQ